MLSSANVFLNDERGATAIEYGLIVSLMTIVCVAGFIALGSGAGGMWGKVGDLVSGALR